MFTLCEIHKKTILLYIDKLKVSFFNISMLVTNLGIVKKIDFLMKGNQSGSLQKKKKNIELWDANAKIAKSSLKKKFKCL
jgi:hypothetical protein